MLRFCPLAWSLGRESLALRRCLGAPLRPPYLRGAPTRPANRSGCHFHRTVPRAAVCRATEICTRRGVSVVSGCVRGGRGERRTFYRGEGYTSTPACGLSGNSRRPKHVSQDNADVTLLMLRRYVRDARRPSTRRPRGCGPRRPARPRRHWTRPHSAPLGVAAAAALVARATRGATVAALWRRRGARALSWRPGTIFARSLASTAKGRRPRGDAPGCPAWLPTPLPATPQQAVTRTGASVPSIFCRGSPLSRSRAS